ncbi:MAG: hypothetical protein J6N71_09705 [Muribaculaceae bacterium]|nr:hypothetical protein [Muribaculaceae bacterium]
MLGHAGTDTNGNAERAYIVGNAHEFVGPIGFTPDEAEQHFDLLKRVNTTIHIPRCPFVKGNGNELVLPVNSFLYSLAWNECGFTIELVGDLAKLVLDEHGMLKPFTRYTLWRGDQGRTFVMDADCDIRHELTTDGDLRRYPSALAADGTTTRARLYLSCRFPVND